MAQQAAVTSLRFVAVDFSAPKDANAAPAIMVLENTPAPSGTWSFELEPDTALLRNLQPQQRQDLAAAGVVFLHGELAGVSGSWVRMAKLNDAWQGMIHDGDALWLVEPAAKLLGVKAANAGDYALFRADHIDWTGVTDIVLDPSGKRVFDADHGVDISDWLPKGATSGLLIEAEFTAVYDQQLVNAAGGDTEAMALVMARVQFMAGLYENQLGVRFELAQLARAPSNAPLTTNDASDLLSEFRAYVGDNNNGINRNDVAHLFTGRNIAFNGSNSTAGIAYLGVICRTSAVAVNEDLGNATIGGLVAAHEMGHNFSAPHDGSGACEAESFRGIMAPSVSSSRQDFSPCSLEQMTAHAESRLDQCLTLIEPTLFRNGFEQQ